MGSRGCGQAITVTTPRKVHTVWRKCKAKMEKNAAGPRVAVEVVCVNDAVKCNAHMSL